MMLSLPFLTPFVLRARRALLALVLLPLWAQAQELPVLTLSVLQFGTPHWELEHLKRQGLDRANGFELKVRLVADVPASRLALTSGSVDGAVSDLLWAQARYQAGTAYRYVPFSSQIGEVLVPEGSAIRTLADLRGKRIGFSLAECKTLIELYDPKAGNQKQLNIMLQMIAERRQQLEQQLLDIQQMQLELDTAEERCRSALESTLAKQAAS